MLALAALLLAASATSTPALTSAAPWWERITYTISDDGDQQACEYQSSDSSAQSCDDESGVTSTARGAPNGTYSKISVERRFSPGAQPLPVSLQSGDTLLGGQIIELAIDDAGAVQTCKVIGASGDLKPPYGCDEARAERFAASARRGSSSVHTGYMTIVVFGHEEYLA